MGVERFNRPLSFPYLTLVEATGVKVQLRVNAGAPTDGTSGTAAGQAGPGSLLIDTTNNVLYKNGGTLDSPDWQPAGGGIDGAVEVRNESGLIIEDGDVVYLSGWNETETLPLITLADADAQGRPAEFVIRSDIANSANGLAFKTYRETGGLNLAAGVVGDPIYLSTAPGDGTLVDPKDTDPNAISQVIGRIAVVATDVAEYNLNSPLEMVGTNELQAGLISADVAGRALIVTDYFNEATVDDQFAAGAIDGDRLKSGGVGSDRLADPQTFDAGAPARATLRMDADVVDAQTVTIGADVYEFEDVSNDGGNDTQGGDFNNTTDTLTLPTFTTDYAAVTPVAVGDLIRIQNEIMVITAADGTSRTFARGVSGTSAATHANGQDVLDGNGTSGSNIAVGLAGTLTPAAAMPALVADINDQDRASEAVLATQITVNELLLQTATAAGGTISASAATTATTETLGGANNEWDTANLRSGKVAGARRLCVIVHTVDQTEVDLGAVRVTAPFNISSFIAQVYNSSGELQEALTDQITATGTRVDWDGNGAVNPVAGDIIHIIAWD